MTAPPSFRLVVSQLRPRKGGVDHNLARVATEAEGWAGRAEVVVLPETFLSGYFVEGGIEAVALTGDELVARLGSPPDHAPDLILGAYERVHGAFHNTALHLEPADGRWRIVHRHRKSFLPTYGVFDEARFVTPGREVRAYDTRFGRMGLLICEEMLHSIPPTLLALDGAEVVVALAASPARDFAPGHPVPGNLERWDVAGRAITLEHGSWLAVAQAVGSEGGRLFAGGSVVYGPGGTIDARATLFREHHLEVEIDRGRVHRQRIRSPLLADLRDALPHLLPAMTDHSGSDPVPPSEVGARPAADSLSVPESVARPDAIPSLELNLPLVEEALVSFLEDEVRRRRGFHRVVVGVSGGVDSAVTLALAVRAFGAEAVHPILLPYATSAPESLDHARLLCEMLGVEPRIIPITDGVDAYVDAEEPELSPLRRGNLAARYRALVLWDQSARHDALVLGTGNKSERLLGYFTWHADDSPPVNPLGDLYKTQVLALARHLDIPEPIVGKPPSADLVEGVHDEDEIGVSYAVADPILAGLLEGFTPRELVAMDFGADDVERVRSRLEGTHWKRALPTVAMISSTGIGDFYLRPVDF
jgi:NAD+ synthase (glutamine-hydrolysing)